MLKIEQFNALRLNLDKIGANTPERVNNFCNRIDGLDSGQQDFLIDLVGRFVNCKFIQLPEYYKKACSSVPSAVFEHAHRIMFTPLEDNSLRGKSKKPKSGTHFCRMLRSFATDLPIRDKEKIFFCETCKELFNHYSENDLVVLVDDFVGTGTTVQDTLAAMFNYAELTNKCMPSLSSIIVLAAVGMKRGLGFCWNTLRIPCYVGHVQDKTISANPLLTEEGKHIQRNMMRSIERKLFPKMKHEYSLGYMQGEALVNILEKCPNNTFPVYWYGKRPAPMFVRNY